MAAHRLHQFGGLQGLIEQDVQAHPATGQQVIRRSVAAHGHRRQRPWWWGSPRVGGCIVEQLQTKAIGQLQIEQHQVIPPLGQEGAGPAQIAAFLDHAVGPGVLEDHPGAQALDGLVVDNEQTQRGGRGHDRAPAREESVMTPPSAGANNPVFWVAIANLIKYGPTEERCSLHPFHAGEARIFIQPRSPTVDVR
jgi:hypothetical protein